MINLYCNCINNQDNRHTQQKQKNILCGAEFLDSVIQDNYKNKNFILDNQLDNISCLNPWFGDLTGLYWVWKNTDHEFVGTNQYRRFWDDDHINNLSLSENVLYVSHPLSFPDMSIMEQYTTCHGTFGLAILDEAIRNGRIDMNLDFINCLNYNNSLSSCNMFFAHNTIFNKLCDILFGVVFELYEGSKYSLPYFFPDHKHDQRLSRIFAFLSERLLTVIYINRKYYLGDVEISFVPYNTIQ